MTSNGPIVVSAPGTSLTGANASNITFSTRNPFHKLDSTNSNSFQIITIFLSHETPNPTIGNTLDTIVYQFAHGYTYVPSTWFLVSLNNFTTVLGSEGVWIIGNATGTNPVLAKLNITVDATNVYFTVSKTWFTGGVPPSVLGFFLSIRSYIFIEDLLGGSVPSQP